MQSHRQAAGVEMIWQSVEVLFGYFPPPSLGICYMDTVAQTK